MKHFGIRILIILLVPSISIAHRDIPRKKNVPSRVFCAPFAFKAKEVNVAYATDPVPASTDCICPQEVFDTDTTVHYGSDVEPTIAVDPTNPCRLCAAWQNDRIFNGGALECGIAYSVDGGLSWKNALVPFQICIDGLSQRISDVWLSWSIDGKRVYLNVLYFNSTLVTASGANQSGIATSVSLDGGATWGTPVFNITSCNYNNEPTLLCPFDDKNSVTADPFNPLVAYSVWDRFPITDSFHSDSFLSKTIDGGVTWSTGTLIYNPFLDPGFAGLSNGIENDVGVIGDIAVRVPAVKGGALLNFVTRFYATPTATDLEYTSDVFPFQFTLADIIVQKSVDNGATWSNTATFISHQAGGNPVNTVVFTGGYTYSGNTITGGLGTALRTGGSTFAPNGGGGLATPAVNPVNGNLYVVWQDSIFRSDKLCQVALSVSRDGGTTWSSPVQVSQTNITPPPNPQAFSASVAVTKNGYVGVLYSDFRNDPVGVPNTATQTLSDTWLAIFKETASPTGGSTGVGLDFVTEIRLTKQSYIVQNGATTSQGVMVSGDYQTVVADALNFYAIYIEALNGPFRTPTVLCTDPQNNATVTLDTNKRQQPFVSVIQTCP